VGEEVKRRVLRVAPRPFVPGESPAEGPFVPSASSEGQPEESTGFLHDRQDPPRFLPLSLYVHYVCIYVCINVCINVCIDVCICHTYIHI
jgi:hypothetical protein